VTVRLPATAVVIHCGSANQGQGKAWTDPFDEEDRRAKFFLIACRRLGEAVLTSLYDRLQSLDDAVRSSHFLEAAFASTISKRAALATTRRGLVSA